MSEWKTLSQIRRISKETGLDYLEYLEMAYENLKEYTEQIEKEFEKIKKKIRFDN